MPGRCISARSSTRQLRGPVRGWKSPPTPATGISRSGPRSDSCPSAREIPLDMRQKVGKIDGIKEVNLAVVWDPPWHPRMISEEARKELGIDDESLED